MNLTVETVKQFIDLHFIDVDAIHGFIRDQNISEKWLRTWFKKRYGMSPLKYRQHLLFERARRLLINTNLCVKEIAFQLGYENQNYFSRAFKAHFGASPQNFRE